MSSALSTLWYGPSGPRSTSVNAASSELSIASRTSATMMTSSKRGISSGTARRARTIPTISAHSAVVGSGITDVNVS